MFDSDSESLWYHPARVSLCILEADVLWCSRLGWSLSRLWMQSPHRVVPRALSSLIGRGRSLAAAVIFLAGITTLWLKNIASALIRPGELLKSRYAEKPQKQPSVCGHDLLARVGENHKQVSSVLYFENKELRMSQGSFQIWMTSTKNRTVDDTTAFPYNSEEDERCAFAGLMLKQHGGMSSAAAFSESHSTSVALYFKT